ncbi:nudix hydrolase 20 [Collybia nuda]|uniref:Nudix hydrolase 20 n=1 Tax=Collybia nuda TaxID=64659 RepID=A0A9P5YC25_9AGAR|nr:nudix hydrolase 20 [Collybia nuda]
MERSHLSFLDLINICDNFRVHQSPPLPTPFDSERLIPLYLTESLNSPTIGLLRPIIVQQLKAENELSRDTGKPELWNILSLDATPRVAFQPWLDTPTKRTVAMAEMCERWRDSRLFDDVCGPKKWRNERFPIYADPFGARDYPGHTAPGKSLNFVFELERSACALFGVVTYGVLMSIYKELEVNGQKTLRVWVPRRARTKPTWPGYLDSSVAGGAPSGIPMFECIIKECMEEANIAPDITRKHARCIGAISYFFRTSAGWLQPEIEYLYDLSIPSDMDPDIFQPKPLDGEVESFALLPHDDIIQKMRAGLFKPDCALVLIDLFIRLGYITPENEPDFMKIVTRLHGRFDYERW